MGTIVWRELLVSARRKEVASLRVFGACLAAAIVAGCVVAWDWWLWDRTSITGKAQMAVVAFGCIVTVHALITLGLVPSQVGPGIALEREKKTLDALLGTRLSSFEIVLGKLVAGLARFANPLMGGLPVVVLLVPFGGVDPRWVVLALAGISTTALLIGALSIAFSVESRAVRFSMASTVVVMVIWLDVPMIVSMLPAAWPASMNWIGWIRPLALVFLDSSPTGVFTNMAGLIRRTTPVGSVLRMIGWETVVRSRCYCCGRRGGCGRRRGVSDGDGRSALFRSLKRQQRARPSCGDDPIYWNDVHSTHGASALQLVFGKVVLWVTISLLAVATAWFAISAFAELVEYGYGPSAQRPVDPEFNPVALVLVNMLGRVSLLPVLGQSRLEFNIALRVITAAVAFLYALMVAGAAVEAIAVERDRDTWTGLLATPLSGREILKIQDPRRDQEIPWSRGAPGRALDDRASLRGLLHPLGVVAAVVVLSTSTGCFVACGTLSSLWLADRKQATGRVLSPVVFLQLSGMLTVTLPAGYGSVLLGVGSVPLLAWLSLLSYDDVQAIVRDGSFPALAFAGIKTGEGPANALTTWLIGTIGYAVAVLVAIRVALRTFDTAVGRPQRPNAPFRTRPFACQRNAGTRGLNDFGKSDLPFSRAVRSCLLACSSPTRKKQIFFAGP